MIVLTAMVLVATAMHEALAWLEGLDASLRAAPRGATGAADSSTRR
jgi:hypothetical protein